MTFAGSPGTQFDQIVVSLNKGHHSKEKGILVSFSQGVGFNPDTSKQKRFPLFCGKFFMSFSQDFQRESPLTPFKYPNKRAYETDPGVACACLSANLFGPTLKVPRLGPCRITDLTHRVQQDDGQLNSSYFPIVWKDNFRFQ